MPMELSLNKKKGMCLPHVSSIFKIIGPKTLDCTFRERMNVITITD